MTDLHPQIIRLGDLLAEHKGVTHWRISFLLTGGGRFLHRLKSGKTCNLKTANRVMQGLSDMWPEDLKWPADIERPEPNRREVA